MALLWHRPTPRGGGQTSTLALSLVIPTFNEGQNLAPLVARLTRLLDPMLPNDYELIVVDDDSPDRTWEQALTLGQTLPQLRVLRRCHERGLSSAVIRGWQVARGRILGVIDADLQHPPEVILPLWQGMQAGADLAVGSRHVDGGGVSQWSLTRRMLSRGAQTLGLLVLPQVVGRVSDPMSGFFMVRRDAIAGPILNPKGYKILLEVIARGTITTISEVGYVFQERVEGASKSHLAAIHRLHSSPPPPEAGGAAFPYSPAFSCGAVCAVRGRGLKRGYLLIWRCSTCCIPALMCRLPAVNSSPPRWRFSTTLSGTMPGPLPM